MVDHQPDLALHKKNSGLMAGSEAADRSYSSQKCIVVHLQVLRELSDMPGSHIHKTEHRVFHPTALQHHLESNMAPTCPNTAMTFHSPSWGTAASSKDPIS